MNFGDLTPEQKKIAGNRSADELVALAREEGMDLTDEQLEQISGGGWSAPDCPRCSTSSNVTVYDDHYVCSKCGLRWTHTGIV